MRKTTDVRYAAPAAACAADLLLVLARSTVPLTCANLSELTGASKSLTYRVLAELGSRDYIRRSEDGTFSLGPAVIELGGAFAASVPTLTSVRHILRGLADETQETVSLGMLQGDQVLYLVREEGTRSVFAVSHVGKLLPANAVGLGKALLAAEKNPAVRDRFAHQLGDHDTLVSLTPDTITDLEMLLDDLFATRRRGHAEEHGEATPGRCCIACAVDFGEQGIERVAISVSMNESRFTAEREPLLAALFRARDQFQAELRARSKFSRAPTAGDFVLKPPG